VIRRSSNLLNIILPRAIVVGAVREPPLRPRNFFYATVNNLLSPQGIFPGDDDLEVSPLDGTQLRFHLAVGIEGIITPGPIPGLAFEIIPQIRASENPAVAGIDFIAHEL
jgi:hypothetical protein